LRFSPSYKLLVLILCSMTFFKLFDVQTFSETRSEFIANVRGAVTHLLNPCFHANPKHKPSVCIFTRHSTVSHVPKLCKCGKPRFHRHRRAGGFMRVLSRRHSYATNVLRFVKVLDRVVVDDVVMKLMVSQSVCRDAACSTASAE